MYSISRFQQIIKPVTNGIFQRHVNRHQADRYCKKFTCRDLLISQIFANLSGCTSLRTLESSFNSHTTHHYHLGTQSLRRSTIADAMHKRDVRPFADMAARLMQQCSRSLRKQSEALLYLLDSTPIRLTGRGFDEWCSSNGRIRGIKMHVLMDQLTACPVKSCFSAADVNDIDIGKTMKLEKGAVYVFDKGYCDYNWWYAIHKKQAFFVTRLKSNAAVQVNQSLPLDPERKENIISDEIISFKHKQNRGKGRINHYHGKPLRRITVAREGKEPLILVSNQLEAEADTIAGQYRQRWQIELLFKWLKQHLKVKAFFGRSENAVHIQLLCALITYLLLQLYKKQHNIRADLHLLLAQVSGALFERPETVYACHCRRLKERQRFLERQGVLL